MGGVGLCRLRRKYWIKLISESSEAISSEEGTILRLTFFIYFVRFGGIGVKQGARQGEEGEGRNTRHAANLGGAVASQSRCRI